MTSVGFRRSSLAFLSRCEDVSDGDDGLRVAYIGMRRPYVHLEEPSVGPLRQTSVSFTMPFFLPEPMLGGCTISLGFFAPSACLRRSFVGLDRPSVDLR